MPLSQCNAIIAQVHCCAAHQHQLKTNQPSHRTGSTGIDIANCCVGEKVGILKEKACIPKEEKGIPKNLRFNLQWHP